MALETSSDDQPTDLSLPKSSYKQTEKALGLAHSLVGHQEGKTISQFQVMSSQTNRDCNPKACQVSTMTMLAPQKYIEFLPRSRKSHHLRLQYVRKMEGMVHPMIHHKTSPQNIGAAHPLKRSLEDLDLVISGKKIPAVSPLDSSKEALAKDKASEQDGESFKLGHEGHANSTLESHKLFPLLSYLHRVVSRNPEFWSQFSCPSWIVSPFAVLEKPNSALSTNATPGFSFACDAVWDLHIPSKFSAAI